MQHEQPFFNINSEGLVDKDAKRDAKTPQTQPKTSSQVSVFDMLQIVAFVCYVAAAIAAIVSFCASETSLGFISLLSGFISGTVFLGFAEIIKLLNQINNKLK